MKNFWNELKKPILILAPMEDVTDTVFRQIVAECGRPDVFFTEFTSTDGLCSRGFEKVAERLKFSANEHPIVAQIWGNDPNKYFESAKIIAGLALSGAEGARPELAEGFDGIDINMGCPDKTIVSHGCCSGLINNPSLAEKLISSAKKGAPGLPISVKTRLGYKDVNMEWIKFLLGQNLDALTIHGRTVVEMSGVPAHWDEIGKVVELRNSLSIQTLIIGNGDVKSLDDANEKYKKYKVDGIMIGRGIFENLWMFNKNVNPKNISYKEKLKLLIKHIELFDKTWGKNKNFSIMKKFYKIYVSDVEDASDFRAKLMTLNNAKETIEFIKTKL